MPASPIRRRTSALAAGAIALVLLVGCTGQQRDAGNYEDTEERFLRGCIATAQADAEAGGAVIASPRDWCRCAFDAIEDEVEFDVFREANSDLRENGGELPQEIQDAYASCDPALTGS